MSGTTFSPETDTAPFGVAVLRDFFPRVVTKRGNPGLCDATASRLCYISSKNSRRI